METERYTVMKTLKRFREFKYILILEGIMVGALAGLVVVLFRVLLDKATGLLDIALAYGRLHSWFIPVWFVILAVAAVIACLLLKWEPYISGSGIPQLEGEMQGEIKQNWFKVLVGKFTGALLTLGCGLSLGREGPSIQLGAITAKGFSRMTKRMRTEERLLMTCGASAGLSAAFNAPIAGVLFSLEEIHKNFSPEVLLSSMASSITADFISRNVFGLKPVFTFHISSMMPLGYYGHVMILGIILGMMGVVYNKSVLKSQELYKKIPSQQIRLLIPFMMAGALGFLYPSVLGGGHHLVDGISTGEMALGALMILFIIKFVFSMISFGSGAPGGIFLPLLVLGAVIGGIYHGAANTFMGVDSGLLGNFVILGMAGYFAAIVRAPMTGIILISEMTGSFSHLLTLSLVSLCAYLVPDILRCPPIYDSLLHRIVTGSKGRVREPGGEKVLVDGMVYHGALAEGKVVSQLNWPEASLLVSLMRGETEVIPKGDTRLRAGDRLVLLCDEEEGPKVHRMLEEQCQQIHKKERKG